MELDKDLHSLAFRLNGGSLHHFGKDFHISGPFKEALFRIDVRDRIRRITGGSKLKEGLSTSELRALAQRIDQRVKNGLPPNEKGEVLPSSSLDLWREYFSRFSFPATCLVLPWIAVPLALFTRTDKKSYAFAISLLIIFGSYLFLALGKALTLNGLVSPFLGCWLPVFALAFCAGILTPFAVRR